jgi:hypothetical protein
MANWGGANVVHVGDGSGSGSVWGDVLTGLGDVGSDLAAAYLKSKEGEGGEENEGIAGMLSKNYRSKQDMSPLFEQQDELTDEDLDPYEQQRRAFARF